MQKREMKNTVEALFIELDTYYYLISGLYKERFISPPGSVQRVNINLRIQASQKKYNEILVELEKTLVTDPDLDKQIKSLLYES